LNLQIWIYLLKSSINISNLSILKKQKSIKLKKNVNILNYFYKEMQMVWSRKEESDHQFKNSIQLTKISMKLRMLLTKIEKLIYFIEFINYKLQQQLIYLKKLIKILLFNFTLFIELMISNILNNSNLQLFINIIFV